MKPDARRRALIVAVLLSPAARAGDILNAGPAMPPFGPADAIRYLMEEVLVSPAQRELALSGHTVAGLEQIKGFITGAFQGSVTACSILSLS